MKSLPWVGPHIATLDPVERVLYLRIRDGERVTSEGDHKNVNALTKLRRNGIIENRGSRSNPEWIAKPPIGNDPQLGIILAKFRSGVIILEDHPEPPKPPFEIRPVRRLRNLARELSRKLEV